MKAPKGYHYRKPRWDTSVLYVGAVFTTNYCGKCKVIDIETAQKVTVEFIKTGYTTVVRQDHLTKGSVSDPYAPTVWGHGYVGEGKFSRTLTPEVYFIWKNMLQRCYSEAYHKAKPTYVGCKVSKSWLCLQNFGRDLTKMENWESPDYQLDKDLMRLGNKLYSKETCVMVHREVNALVRCGVNNREIIKRVVRKFKHELPKKVRVNLNALAA